ncbi:MAG: PfkB family carbohydrate kinase [Candidatus Bathyarchaeota archaeon]|nr:PfkB family carbohydrate kinase [Candidatus Bathyarchaeota archaeon]MCX8177927.1 PfkB family carbohydrate kinase [Candidatus Bathyarchaeota archaeon]MDW8194252.1 PfkB family carbohydrate kinase [Nitrososphaerota archaeon]
MFDIVVIGHFSIDSITLPSVKKPYVILGGSAAYVSLSAKSLGVNVAVISKVGDDFPKAYLWWLSREGVDLSGVIRSREAWTTKFELKYSEDFSERNLRLISRAPPITMEDLPKTVRAKAIHVAPIANEISYEVIEGVRRSAEILSLDPQGLIRVFDDNGNVSYRALEKMETLSLVDIYKSTYEEIKALTGEVNLKNAIRIIHDHGVKTVIVTLGNKGAALSVEGAICNIPAYKPPKVVDPTGAGDAFIGGFLAEYLRGSDMLWCACVGSAIASTAVESIGPTFSSSKSEIYQRARTLYEEE